MENKLTDRITIRLSDSQVFMIHQLIKRIDCDLSQSEMIRLLIDAVYKKMLQSDIVTHK